MAETVTIETLGHRGDGVAREAGGPLYVPFTLPGERVLIERDGSRARLIEILQPSAERVLPLCRHFGACGGCALQMLPLERTRTVKRGFVVEALRQQNLDVEVAATVGVPVASRRRATFAAIGTERRVLFGYHERLSHRIVDLAECPVLSPALQAAIDPLRSLVGRLLPRGKPARVTVLQTRSGLDVAIDGVPLPSPRQIASLAAPSQAAGIARLAFSGDVALAFADPVVEVSGASLVPPPGAFLQASAEAEAAMTGLVAEHLGGARRVADLFSGVGTFALALARFAPVHAVEASEAALAALSTAARRAAGLKPVTTERRDLFADPLSEKELERFDAVVFDPPYAGARAQTEALAGSTVRRIAAVSCNPGTFARDARILVDGGYALERVVPVDQFVYSAETEVVGLFSRS